MTTFLHPAGQSTEITERDNYFWYFFGTAFFLYKQLLLLTYLLTEEQIWTHTLFDDKLMATSSTVPVCVH